MLYQNGFIRFGLAATLLLSGCEQSEFVEAAKLGAMHLTDSQEYSETLKSLLIGDWVMEQKEIRVWHKPDSKADAREDLSEVEEKVIRSAAEVVPMEIGLGNGSPIGRIYGGPYLLNYKNTEYLFALSRDDRTWGYDHDRCFMLYKKKSEVQAKEPKTHLRGLSCKDANQITSNAIVPEIPGFEALSERGKEILNGLSDRQWSKTKDLRFRSSWTDREVLASWKEKFKFNFWDDFSKFNYQNSFSDSGGSSHWIGPFTDLPVVRKIGERKVNSDVSEFVIWADRRFFFLEIHRHMSFVTGKSEFWAAESMDQVKAIEEPSLAWYRYPALEKEGDEIYGRHRDVYHHADAHYIVLRYDETKPGELEVQFHMVDPLFPSVTTVYQAE